MSVSEGSEESCQPSASECEALNGRRDFIRAGLMAVGALATMGVTPDQLWALEARFASGRRVGDELRFPLPTADGAIIDEANKVIIARVAGVAMAFVLECPHRGADVEWQSNRNRFFCPKHRSTFQPNGTLIGGKANRGLDRYAIRREGDELVVDTSRKLRSTNEAAWTSAQVSL
jgi:nitrite reductase/ring-hydroxylating ferredoxin subunit